MSGLEKIISQIEEEAGHSAEEIIREAREQAEAILGAAEGRDPQGRHSEEKPLSRGYAAETGASFGKTETDR